MIGIIALIVVEMFGLGFAFMLTCIYHDREPEKFKNKFIAVFITVVIFLFWPFLLGMAMCHRLVD